MKYFIYLFLTFVLAVVGKLHGQRILPVNVPVSQQGRLLQNPFAGGLTAPQFSEADLNNDGTDDLVVFDRTGDVVLPFLRVDNQYLYAPEYNDRFPSPRQWMLMRDYDGDGIQDIFMAPTVNGIAGIEVQKGYYENDSLRFELVSITDDGFNVLYVPFGSIETQVYNSLIDFPGIDDLDGDGDLDIVAFEPGGSTITYYRNYSVERTGERGLDFEIEDDCFGRIVESGFSEEITLSSDGLECGNTMLQNNSEIRHAGSTIALFDQNNNGILDALIGDISNDGLVLLSNGGDAQNAWFNVQDVHFPTVEDPIEINIFNGAYFVDLNEDDLKDLVVAPNELSGIQTVNHIWRYKAVSDDDGVDFQLQNKNFLVDEMCFFGKDATPAFFDYNNDLLMDIVVGAAGLTDFNLERNPRLILLENVGSIEKPSFAVVDDDYLGFSEFVTTSTHFFPSFGDLDNDGDIDLLVGDDNGYFYFLENSAGIDKLPVFENPVYEFQNLKPGQFVKPSIYDVNKDGLSDLVIGERNFNTENDFRGSLNYVQNSGEAGNPIFDTDHSASTQVFGKIFTKDQGFIRNLSAPTLFESEGRTMMMVGTESGKLKLYDHIDGNLDGAFTELSSEYGGIKVGNNSTPALFDLDNDGYFELLVGNRRGGLSLFTTDLKSIIRRPRDDLDDLKIEVIPNPAWDRVRVSSEVSINQLVLFNSSGQIIASSNQGEIKVSGYTPGVYWLKIHYNDQTLVRMIVIM